ncbi:nitrate reductase [Halothiobacillus diazotrophicus]|uniref:Nitrate reductase n=1 Tax=Halothiobacillus diazotrophicus TaxID=1860122 RepID=A0A191ZDR2_9GAMM|nr:nitrate reductase [Halothiobacillus diazotrophicus]ANJ66006.1 nitrate reductase [Halothiobacillus diazotrophicus]
MNEFRTTCPYCGVGCGVIARQDDASGQWSVAGDKEHPANYGRLCSKGSALAETLDLPHRLTAPKIRQPDGALQETDWNTAMDRIAEGFRRTIEEYGPNSVAMYVSGQILTEDYYVANKLMKGFIGTANIDTNSRLCMSSAVAAHNRAFGADTVPVSYDDLEQADLVVLTGSNTAWAHPVVFQRLVAAKERRPEMTFVVIDPRRTATCDIADLHLPLAPGTDALLFNGLLVALAQAGKLDMDFVHHHVDGFDETLAAARHDAPDIETVAQRCGLPQADLERFFDLFAKTERTVTLWSQGLNQSASGTDKGNALINCHLATGRIGKPAMGPFSITGQPNAMGGREVGGLANQLAAHQGFTPADIDRVARFWQSDRVARAPGLKAVDMFKGLQDGHIKAIWIVATNPAFSLPNANQVRAALAACPLVVLSECVENTDTAAFADILLPATTWGERDGTVTNSERRITRQLPFIAPPTQARHDWQMICELGRRLGFAQAFDYPDSAAIFREYAAMTGFENAGSRDLDISAFAQLDKAAYDALEPSRWPQPADRPAVEPFSDGRFFTPNGRARMIPIHAKGPASPLNPAHPLRLNTGRLRDQWHGMTRTGIVPRLMTHFSEPTVSVHPSDAARFKLRGHQIARLGNAHGIAYARVLLDDNQRPGSLFMPLHWNHAYARHGLVNALVNGVVDPVSGQPEFKTMAVWAEPYPARWFGFALLAPEFADRTPTDWPGDYAVTIPGANHHRIELAGVDSPDDWLDWAKQQLSTPQTEGDATPQWIEFADPGSGRFRIAQIRQGRLDWVLHVTPDSRAVDTDWLAGLFAEDELSPAMLADLMAGKPAGVQDDRGPIICACFSIGRNSLLKAIADEGITDVKTLGECTQAGTNCGSCIPELKLLLQTAGTTAGSKEPA